MSHLMPFSINFITSYKDNLTSMKNTEEKMWSVFPIMYSLRPNLKYLFFLPFFLFFLLAFQLYNNFLLRGGGVDRFSVFLLFLLLCPGSFFV